MPRVWQPPARGVYGAIDARDPHVGAVIDRLSPLRVALLTAVPALIYRVVLTRVYWGQEEGDWGNLGLIVGTSQSGFTYIETEHMPLYSMISALLYRLTGDAMLAGELVAVPMGALMVGLVAWMTARWLSPAAGLVAGALVAVQPDLALLSSTTLRHSSYCALAVATVLAVGQARWLLAGALFWGAFLMRFDAMFAILPAMALAAVVPALHDPTAASLRRRMAGLALAVSVLPAWAAVYARVEGTPAFWSSIVGRNTLAYDDLGLGGQLAKGGETLLLVTTHVLPDHLSWVVMALAPVGLAAIVRRRGPGHRPVWLALVAVATTGLFILMILLSAYRWDHNLYWRWLALSLPFSLPLAAHGAVVFVSWLRPRPAAVVAVILAGSAALPMYRQTWHQLIRSDAWIGTQVRFAAWAERAAPPGTTILADLIPATWLSRHEREPRRVLRWSQLKDTLPRDLAGLGAWLEAEDVSVIIWFAEPWVGAAEIAPALGTPRRLQAGPATLVPIAQEEGYGFVGWRVDLPGRPGPTEPVPADAGALPAR